MKLQTLLDRADLPYPVERIHDEFMPLAREASQGLADRWLPDGCSLPDACFSSIEAMITALAKRTGQLPPGHGQMYIRHFDIRARQLQDLRVRTRSSVERDGSRSSVEYHFSLIELSLLGALNGTWDGTPCRSLKAWRSRLADVAQSPRTPDRERWLDAITRLLEECSMDLTIMRTVACALAWCGQPAADKQLAEQFGLERTEFIRARKQGFLLLWLIISGLSK